MQNCKNSNTKILQIGGSSNIEKAVRQLKASHFPMSRQQQKNWLKLLKRDHQGGNDHLQDDYDKREKNVILGVSYYLDLITLLLILHSFINLLMVTKHSFTLLSIFEFTENSSFPYLRTIAAWQVIFVTEEELCILVVGWSTSQNNFHCKCTVYVLWK